MQSTKTTNDHEAFYQANSRGAPVKPLCRLEDQLRYAVCASSLGFAVSPNPALATPSRKKKAEKLRLNPATDTKAQAFHEGSCRALDFPDRYSQTPRARMPAGKLCWLALASNGRQWLPVSAPGILSGCVVINIISISSWGDSVCTEQANCFDTDCTAQGRFGPEDAYK